MKLTASGSIDTSFGSSGLVQFDLQNFDRGSERVSALRINGDGSIFLAATSKDFGVYSQARFYLFKLSPNGVLDDAFGSNGSISDAYYNSSTGIIDIAETLDSKIVARMCGSTRRNLPGSIVETDSHALLARFNSDGTSDRSFGSSGRHVQTYTPTGRIKLSSRVIEQYSGEFIFDGVQRGSLPADRRRLQRLDIDGRLDTRFENSDIASYQSAALEGGFSTGKMLQLADGKLIAAYLKNESSSDFVVDISRYNSDGSRDVRFNGGTTYTARLPAGVSPSGAEVVTQDSKGNLLLLVRDGGSTPVPWILIRIVEDPAKVDTDGDGILDIDDAFPTIPIGNRTDTDGDGAPNDCDLACQQLGMTADLDDDGDGFTDIEEIEAGSNPLDSQDQPTQGGIPMWLIKAATDAKSPRMMQIAVKDMAP